MKKLTIPILVVLIAIAQTVAGYAQADSADSQTEANAATDKNSADEPEGELIESGFPQNLTNAFPTLPAPPPRRIVPVMTGQTGTNAAATQAPQTRTNGAAPSSATLPAFPTLPSPPGAGAAPGATVPAPPAVAQPGAGAAAVTAQPPEPQPQASVSIRFPNAPVDQVLDFYAELVGRTILRSPLVPPTTTITIKAQTPLTRSEAQQALDTVLALNNITMIPMGEKFVTAVPVNQALLEGAAFDVMKSGQLPEAAQFVTQVIHLTNALPSEVVASLTPFAKVPNGIVAIDSSQVLVIRDYSINVKRMMEVIEQVDVELPDDYSLEVIPIKYGKVEDIYTVMSGLLSGTPGAATGAARTSSAARTSRFSRVGSRQTTQPGAAQQQAPAAGRTALQQRLQQIVSRAAGGQTQLVSDANIIPDERANSLVVYASKRDMQMITNIVSKLDVALAQVLIESVIIDVTLKDDFDLGISAVQHPKTSGRFTGAGGIDAGGPGFLSSLTNLTTGLPGGFSYFGKIGNDFEVALSAIARSDSATVLQRPRIQTSHAVPATFFNGATVPYITSTYYGGYSSYGPSAQYQQMEVGIGLSVTPYITPDGLVVMEIEQTIDELAGETEISPGQRVPNTTSRTATSTVSVRDGETILLGGFIRTSKSKNRSGVPILKDIPLLGALFRSRSDKLSRSELIVLMRPKVLLTPEEAAAIALKEKEQLPGVRMAEKEFLDAEKKLLEKTEKKLAK